jgi:molybdopterin-containing oxidoreductase family iron-sulfur binding subunit
MSENKHQQRPGGREYWTSLQDLANTPAVQDAIAKEFPGYDPNEMVAAVGGQSRRRFLQLAGASMALAGVTLTGCRRWPKQNLVPQVSRPMGRIPGEPEAYATVMELGGFAQPLLVTTYDGRPIKIEGNPLHPACRTFGGKLGSTSMIAQATLLEMYDPERSRSILTKGPSGRQAASWQAFSAFAAGHFAQFKTAGSKLAVLIEETRSPSVADALARFTQTFGGATVYSYEAVSADNQFTADSASFGAPVRQVFDLVKADRVVCFDADLLGSHPASRRYANDWVQRRKSVDVDKTMNRMYAVESFFSTTGTVADERHPASVRTIEAMVLQLASKAGLESGQSGLGGAESEVVDRLWADISAHPGKTLVAGGANLRPEVLGVINSINAKLGAFGSTINLVAEPARKSGGEQITALVAAMNAKTIDTLLILGGNPVYDAPADLQFASALGNVPTTINLSLYENETSQACGWHVNRAHYLESWGDAESYDGLISVQQPTIAPLFDGKSIPELLAVVSGDSVTAGQDLLYRTWAARLNDPFVATSKAFRKILHDGFVEAAPAFVRAPASIPKPNVGFVASAKGFEVRLVPDYKMHDGRFANNAWLQEVPDPVTKISWDNAALLNYDDAKELGIADGQDDYSTDLIEIEIAGRTLKIPGYVMPGQPKGVVTIPLGYGRRIAGSVRLRTTANMWSAEGAKLTNTGYRVHVATVQSHHKIEPMGFAVREERIGHKSQPGKIVHESTLTAFNKDPHAPHEAAHKLIPLQLFPEPYTTPAKHPDATMAFNEPHAWGMTMDMNACIGCNACVVACQAENNIPTVGKDMVIRNREMHWLRIDRYFKTGGSTYEEGVSDPNPQVTYQPMTCVHCENAPCEQVCPVAATVHDTEGLNTMVYNRCIGTRYCSNNCPYKVRRFNYLDYQSKHPREHWMPWLGIPDTQQEQSVDKIRRLAFNPDVTVRMRGVMEKCTYCTQRIKKVTIDRRNEWQQGHREKPTVDDFDVVTACQQACPTEAIVFGDLNDPNSMVSRLQKNQRAYAVLQELNNRPRTYHLAKLRNPVVEPVAAKVEH